MRNFSGKGCWSLAILGLTMIAFLFGCGSVLQEQKKETAPVTATATSPGSKKSDLPNARYYDFDDILIPNELSPNADKTKIFQTPNLTAGILVLEGNVEVKSLVEFFKGSMARDNWQMKGNFQLPPKSILLFEKKTKRSIIIVEDGTFNTRVDVWTIPVSNGQ
jgi:hypothetical protein